jgi:chromosomal replication initiator protein
MFCLSVETLRTNNRSREIAMPRQIAMYLAKLLTDASLSDIGREFGGKHHTTVMHSVARIHHLRSTDVELNKAIDALLESLH